MRIRISRRTNCGVLTNLPRWRPQRPLASLGDVVELSPSRTVHEPWAPSANPSPCTSINIHQWGHIAARLINSFQKLQCSRSNAFPELKSSRCFARVAYSDDTTLHTHPSGVDKTLASSEPTSLTNVFNHIRSRKPSLSFWKYPFHLFHSISSLVCRPASFGANAPLSKPHNHTEYYIVLFQ